MATRRRTLRYRTHWQQWGFTLIEMMVIVLVIGVLSAIAVPSFGGMLDAAKVNKTVSDLRVSLQETQRQAILKNQACTFTINKKNRQTGSSKTTVATYIQGNCLASGAPNISEDIAVATNLAPKASPAVSSPVMSPSSSPEVEPNVQSLEINFGSLGGAEFAVQSSVRAPNLPIDPSGKLVAFLPEKENVQKKCVAVSSTLGLTRIGTYTGSTDPAEITDRGVCTALDWKEQ